MLKDIFDAGDERALIMAQNILLLFLADESCGILITHGLDRLHLMAGLDSIQDVND